MKMTNGTIVSTINTMATMRDLDLPIQVSFAFTKNFRELIKVNQPYEEEFQKAKDKFKDDDQGFLGALTELQSIELEVSVQTIPIELLLQAAINLSPQKLEILKFMLEEEENGSI